MKSNCTIDDLKIGIRLKAHGEGGKVYVLICIDETENKVALKRESDGLVYTYLIPYFVQKIYKKTKTI